MASISQPELTPTTNQRPRKMASINQTFSKLGTLDKFLVATIPVIGLGFVAVSLTVESPWRSLVGAGVSIAVCIPMLFAILASRR